ncbi:PQQ-binding-like beta-propeller repeat protein [Halosolutus gelatinilyticus]|uniref:outer membrane protein assembly factor BamB family protein n=1 Tax=Halosolutus gelatinilyticus TaxID=2931975 RepID=UPI001FF56E1F|nr:PQQ-binding-like beta-propeller repeat protein [Halosolutus gelatinilyticus]
MSPTRRALLASVGAASVAIAGCSELTDRSVTEPDPDDPPESGVDELPDPSRHVNGANGEWSTFGCNAAHTRAVADGEAPVDGVTERWRVEVAQLAYEDPVVVSGRVYFPDGDTLRVFDADDGTELWTFADVYTAPLLWDGVAYVSTHDAVLAIDSESGETLWERTFETPGRVTTTATYAGSSLICGVGEQVVSLDPEDGSVQWRRGVFGQVIDHTAVFMGYYSIVATEAGMVYALAENGIGWKRWQLPAAPTCPPSVDTDAVYVNCRNGTTHALAAGPNADAADGIQWSIDTGAADRGIGLANGVVFVANGRSLQAISSDSGTRYWEYDIGDWRHTAPAFGRDTLFVGGDRLRAVDPTPGGDPSDGPALRFERRFEGRVGPGPVLDDGTLYVVAEVEEEETYALLALE